VQDNFLGPSSESNPEKQFDDLEAIAARFFQASKSLMSDARKLEAAAKIGDLSAIGKLLQLVDRHFADLTIVRTTLADTNVATLSNAIGGKKFIEDVLEAAAKIGLTGLRVSHNSIFSYPHRVDFESGSSFRLGRRKLTSMRPSSIANVLKAERDKTTLGAPGLLQSLYDAYLLLTKGQVGISVTLSSVYDLLTLLPATKKEYTENDFIVDIGLIDEHGPLTVNDGAKVSFPASTSAGLNRGYSAVNIRGEQVTYASIRFDRGLPVG
jgi:hypothetical protein